MAGSGAGALKGNHQEGKEMSAVEQSKQAVEEKKPEVAPEGVTEAATVSNNFIFYIIANIIQSKSAEVTDEAKKTEDKADENVLEKTNVDSSKEGVAAEVPTNAETTAKEVENKVEGAKEEAKGTTDKATNEASKIKEDVEQKPAEAKEEAKDAVKDITEEPKEGAPKKASLSKRISKRISGIFHLSKKN